MAEETRPAPTATGQPGMAVVRPGVHLAATRAASPARSAPMAGVSEGWQAASGLPWAAGLGWTVVLLGLVLLIYGLQKGYLDETTELASLFWIGLGLSIAGLACAVVFHILPRARPSSVLPTDSSDAFSAGARSASASVLLWKILASVGWAILLLGLAIVAWAYYTVWLAQADITTFDTSLAGRAARYDHLGGGLGLVGLLLFAFTYPRIRGAVASRRLNLIAATLRHGALPPSPSTGAAAPTAGAATSPDVKGLMKKIDGLLAYLPEDHVAEFSKSPEAETYLRLLGE